MTNKIAKRFDALKEVGEIDLESGVIVLGDYAIMSDTTDEDRSLDTVNENLSKTYKMGGVLPLQSGSLKYLALAANTGTDGSFKVYVEPGEKEGHVRAIILELSHPWAVEEAVGDDDLSRRVVARYLARK